MAEDRGGLDYRIDLSGDIEARLDAFIAKVSALDASLTKLGNKTTSAATGGKGNTASITAAEKLAKKQSDLIKKTAQRENVEAVKRTNRLEQDRLRNITNTAKQARAVETKFEKERITAAQKYNKAVTQGADKAQALSAKALKDDILLRDKQAKQAVQARKSAVSSGKELATAQEAESIALQRNTKDTNELAVKKAQILQIQKQSVDANGKATISQRAAAEQVGVTAAQAKKLGLKMWDVEHATRQFLFTFRRLVGILAIFTAARKLAQAIGAAVTQMASFNAEIETAEISIATIISSVGQVRDGTGKLVTGTEAFTASLAASKDILNQLKKDAIGSIATFQALTQAYQVAIGPGLAAGLDLGQIKEVSNGLSEAAIRMGIPINQLSEEIRSLLQGTATARNTRIAVLFGGAKEANEAIRNAKEQGNLYDVLKEKLNGIAEGAKASALTFDVLKANLQDTVQLLLKEGGIEYFNALKESMLGFAKAATQVDAKGQIAGFSPEALGVVQEISNTLAEIITSFRELTDTGQVFVLLRNTIATVGDALKALAPLASGIFQGIVTGVNLVLSPLRLVVDIFRAIARGLGLDKLNKGLSQVVKYLVAAAVAAVLWKKAMELAVSLKTLSSLLGIFSGITKFLLAINVLQSTAAAQAFLTSIAYGNWAVAWGLVNVQALVTAGIFGLIAGVIISLLVHFKVFERLIGVFNKKLSSASKAATGLNNSISSASDATAEGAKSAKEWADALKDAKANFFVADAISGVNGLTKEIIGLLAKETAEFEKQNQTQQDALDLLVQQENALKLRKALLENATNVIELRQELPDVTQEEIDAFTQKIEANYKPLSVFEPPTSDFERYIKSTSSGFLALESKLAVLSSEKEASEEKIRESRKASLAILQEELKTLIAENTYINEESNLKVAEEAKKTTEAVMERANVSAKALAIAKADYAILQAQNDLTKKQGDLELTKLDNEIDKRQKLADAGNASTADLTALSILTTNRVNREAEITQELKTQKSALQEQTKELERQQKLLSGDFTAALNEGLENFVQELPALGFQIADIVSGSLTDLAGTVASVFKDAIDPRTDADLQTAFGEFFLNLAGQFVEAITADLIQSAVDFALQTGAEAATEVATDTATGAAEATAVTTALGLQTASLTADITLQTTSLISFWSASVVPLLAAISAYTAATAVATTADAAIPLAKGGLVKGFAKGGAIKGYASGGNINTLPRPASIPTSDTVPAWLTPGEFVFKKSIVDKIGAPLLNAINNGVLNPASFARTVAPVLTQGRSGVRAFADGGSVGRSAGKADAKAPQQIIVPVQVASENNLNQIIAGGRRVFNSNVNKAPRIGDPNASRGW